MLTGTIIILVQCHFINFLSVWADCDYFNWEIKLKICWCHVTAGARLFNRYSEYHMICIWNVKFWYLHLPIEDEPTISVQNFTMLWMWNLEKPSVFIWAETCNLERQERYLAQLAEWFLCAREYFRFWTIFWNTVGVPRDDLHKSLNMNKGVIFLLHLPGYSRNSKEDQKRDHLWSRSVFLGQDFQHVVGHILAINF